jgi:hypothetical protein
LQESEALICKAFKAAAIVNYAPALITQQMEASGSPEGRKLMRYNDFHPFNLIGSSLYFANLGKMLSLNMFTASHSLLFKIQVLDFGEMSLHF